MNWYFFKEHKIISVLLVLLIIFICRMCMYERIVKNNRVYIINKLTNTYHIQESDNYLKSIKEEEKEETNSSNVTADDLRRELYKDDFRP